ncbi:hypothetical protein EDB85DRAFT_1888858 [Lactarius pseudohatsudake]|nr:hypothetical protein EDB85DRAFT_1888858 [Lactarius pseudohatsudake]
MAATSANFRVPRKRARPFPTTLTSRAPRSPPFLFSTSPHLRAALATQTDCVADQIRWVQQDGLRAKDPKWPHAVHGVLQRWRHHKYILRPRTVSHDITSHGHQDHPGDHRNAGTFLHPPWSRPIRAKLSQALAVSVPSLGPAAPSSAGSDSDSEKVFSLFPITGNSLDLCASPCISLRGPTPSPLTKPMPPGEQLGQHPSRSDHHLDALRRVFSLRDQPPPRQTAAVTPPATRIIIDEGLPSTADAASEERVKLSGASTLATSYLARSHSSNGPENGPELFLY